MESKEIIGQYAIDHLSGEPIRDDEGTRVRGDGSLGLHDSGLFDQNEDSAGEPIDLATGQPMDNSTRTEADDILAMGGYVSDLAPSRDIDSRDLAAQWLIRAEAAAAAKAAQELVDDTSEVA